MQQSGQKKTRNAELTKAKILECATHEFSRHGFAGARVSGITKRAGVNINLVYHYFSGKEGLFIAVMERAYKTIRSHHNDTEIRGLDPIEAMETLVRSTFQLFLKKPEIIGLLNAENLYSASHIRKSKEIETLYHPLLEAIEEILERGAKEGKFRSNVDPIDLFISINAEGYMFLSNCHTLGFVLHENLMDPERVRQREEHIVKVILYFLQFQPPQ
ncbi:TetR/AcrR family transcriptional regulator [Sneathiella litorea]|uniref:TetR family transcriptional regulator n=1 Tax=Sneathiella litorea TaxID=2606216 RepID=A0A6L8W7X6_9PROT|nr:TetR/AcrR family transcriptional regulator [Sneathiella litorea]MZR31216.1 TetR family transcriptional regulator [Sneathiella litorea]